MEAELLKALVAAFTTNDHSAGTVENLRMLAELLVSEDAEDVEDDV